MSSLGVDSSSKISSRGFLFFFVEGDGSYFLGFYFTVFLSVEFCLYCFFTGYALTDDSSYSGEIGSAKMTSSWWLEIRLFLAWAKVFDLSNYYNKLLKSGRSYLPSDIYG